MQTVQTYFFDGLRTAYLADKDGDRFKDDVLWVFFVSSLLAMFASDKKAFDRIESPNNPHDIFNRDMSEVLALPVTDIINLDYAPKLLDDIWRRASVSSQRGTQRGAPLQFRLVEEDEPK